MSDAEERICRQCPVDDRHERRVMLRQEAPDGSGWYLCIKHWLDWRRDEQFTSAEPSKGSDSANAAKTVGVYPPSAPPAIPLPGGASTGTARRERREATKPKQSRSPR